MFWLLKGFSGGNLTPFEESFNVYLNSARITVEIAFGRLKARWRRLLKRLDVHHEFAPKVIAACCILHNIVEGQNDTFIGNWVEDIKRAELIFEQPKIQQINLLMSMLVMSYDCFYVNTWLKITPYENQFIKCQ